MTVLDIASSYLRAGFSVLPIKGDGSKSPCVASWEPFQEQRAEIADLSSLFRANGRPVGVGIIGGKVSGNLEVLDIDDPELVGPFAEAVEAIAPGLLAKIPAVQTPRDGGGRHYYYRCETPPPGNLKLAKSEPRPQFDKKTGEPVIVPATGEQRIAPDTLIETRGEGGYVVAPGSPAECHSTGREYRLVDGPALEQMPTITADERDVLIRVACSFNRFVEEPKTSGQREEKAEGTGPTPGDDFASKTSWIDILTPHGWTVAHARGDVAHWRRPGKTDGISGTTGIKSKQGTDLFCVFSTNAWPFEVPPGETAGNYGKFAAYAVLNHGGDYSAAAKALVEQGFGNQTKQVGRKGREDLPEIATGTDEMRVADETIAALAKRKDLYQRGGVLVEVRESPDPPPCIIRPEGGVRAVQLPAATLREKITDSAKFTKQRETEDGWQTVETAVPKTTVEQVAARGRWSGIPTLEGIVTSPQFLIDGAVLSRPGYDLRSGLYFAGDSRFPEVLERPTLEDAQRARDELLEVIVDFPIDAVGQAAWVSLVLTGAARHAIDGPTPLYAIEANVRGSGKSLSADAVGIIHTGRQLPRTSASGDDEEMRKRVTATLLAGEPLVLLDNINGVLGCASLDALLTSTTWTDRILGQSAMTAAIPAKAIWIATGNNLQFAADTARRTLRIRIVSPLENPEERTGFRHPHLLAWVRKERGRLAAAAVTILRAWHVAGRPDMKLPAWGSFDAWSAIIRNAVVWCGLADPGASRQEVQRESDREAMLLRQLLEAWEDADPHGHGLTVADAIKLADDGHPGLAAIFTEMTGASGKLNKQGFGQKLRHLRGRVCDGRYFDKRDTRLGAAWIVKSAQVEAPPPESCTSSTSSASNPSLPPHTSAHTSRAWDRAGTTGANSATGAAACNHSDPAAWVTDGDRMLCPGCRKFMGRTAQATF